MKWGIDLQSEHERYLTEKHTSKPVVLMNYPNRSKRSTCVNDDDKTVAAMDARARNRRNHRWQPARRRLDVLDARMAETGMDKEHYGWYRDLRRYGTVPHAGFGLGFRAHSRLRDGSQQRPRRHSVSADAGECAVLTRVAEEKIMSARIVDLREVTKPIASPIRNAYIDFSKMTTKPGRRHDERRARRQAGGRLRLQLQRALRPGWIDRERFAPRLREADPESLLDASAKIWIRIGSGRR